MAEEHSRDAFNWIKAALAKHGVSFKPSVSKFPALDEKHLPQPVIVYAAGSIMSDVAAVRRHVAQLRRAAAPLGVRRAVATDWYHFCHDVAVEDARFTLECDGEYSLVVANNGAFGFLAHPWERSWTIFGPLAEAFRPDLPVLRAHPRSAAPARR